VSRSEVLEDRVSYGKRRNKPETHTSGVNLYHLQQIKETATY